MPRVGTGEPAEAGPSRPRAGGADGAGAGAKTKRSDQDGVRRKKKRPTTAPAVNGTSTQTLQNTLLSSQPDSHTPSRSRDRAANINPALRPYLATAPKPVSSLSRSALDEAAPLRQAARENAVGVGVNNKAAGGNGSATTGLGTGLILPSTFLRSRSSLNLSINEGSGVGASGSGGVGAAGGRGGAAGEGDVALPPIQPAPARMYAAGLVAPPLIVPAGSSAAMRQAQAQALAQGRNSLAVPQQSSTPDRAVPARRRDRERNSNRAERNAGSGSGRRRSSEDLRARQHSNMSSTSLTLLPGSSTLVRIPENDTADAQDQNQAQAANLGRRRRRADEQLRRRPTVTSREEGRALGLSRGASMRRVNVWDEVSAVDEQDMPEAPPPFPFPPASGASPTARTGPGAGPTAGGDARMVGAGRGIEGDPANAAPPAFVAGSGPGPAGAPQVPSSPPPTFQQAMGLEPLPHSGDTLLGLPAGSVRRRSSSRALAEADRSNLTTRSSSPAPTVYASAPSSPVASDNEAEEASDSNSSTPGVGTHVGPERIAWDEDIALGYPLEERVRREISRRRRRGEHEDAPIARENEVEPSIEDTEVVSNPGSFPGEHDGSQDGVTSRDPRTDSTAVGAEERRNSAAGVTTRRPSALETAPVSDQPDEIIGGPDRSFSLLTEPSSSPADQTAPAAQEQHGHDSRGSTVARSRPVEGDMSIQGISPHIDDQRVKVVTVTAPSAEATESRSTPQLASPVDTPREMTDANEADDTVTAQPSRKLTRGKAIRRSSSGYGSLSTPGGSAPISPKFEQESQLGGDPRVGFTFRRRSQQSTGSTTPGIPLESPAQQVQSSSPRQPLFGETGFDWRPASVHLAHDALPEADESDGGVLGARNEAGRASAPILLGLSSQAKNARPAQRASIDFVAAGPGRRVGDTSAPVPPPLIQRTSEGSSTSTAGKGQGKHPAAAVLPSGSRFHEMPRRSTEGDILPHRQAAMKRRELYTASIVPADEVSTAVDPGPSRLPAASPTSPSRPRLADPLPSGPLVDFSDYVVDLAPENESFNAKGKARADSVSSAASTGIGSHRSRPLMPLPPELVALFHEDIVEEQDEDENEDGDGDEAEEEEVGSDGVRANGQEGTSQESLQTAVIEPEIDRQTIRSGRSGTSSMGTITPMASREPIDGVESRARPPSLVIDTDKTLPSLPVLPESPSLQAAGTANAVDDADTGRRRAPPPPPALKRHLVSTTVGANLAPRRSIIRTADTPVTPRPIRQLGSGAVAPPLPTRRPPPPPPRPVSQTLQEALQGSASTQVQPVQRMPPHIGQIDRFGTEGNALPAYVRPHPEPYSSPRLDLSDGPTSRSGASATEVPEPPAPASSALSGPLPPPLPPRPLVLRPTYARNDSVVSSNTSSSSDPTTLSRIPPVPTYKPPPTVRPRGPRPKPPPIPARPWIQVVTNDVTLAEAPAEASIDHGARPPAERTQSDNSVRTVPVRSLDSPSSASTVRAPTRRSTSEMDMRGAAATPADAVRSPRSPRSPRVPVARQQSMEYTDLDLLVSRLEGSGREYEGFTQISAFLGPGKTPAASANAISTLLPGLISVDSRRVTKDGKVKLKLSLLGVRVAKCPICLAQFKKDERGVILPECGHHAHETCARKWFKEDGRCFVCREPLVEEQTQQQNNVRSRSGGSSRMVEGVV